MEKIHIPTPFASKDSADSCVFPCMSDHCSLSAFLHQTPGADPISLTTRSSGSSERTLYTLVVLRLSHSMIPISMWMSWFCVTVSSLWSTRKRSKKFQFRNCRFHWKRCGLIGLMKSQDLVMQKYEHDGPPLFSYKGKEIQAAEITGQFGCSH